MQVALYDNKFSLLRKNSQTIVQVAYVAAYEETYLNVVSRIRNEVNVAIKIFNLVASFIPNFDFKTLLVKINSPKYTLSINNARHSFYLSF